MSALTVYSGTPTASILPPASGRPNEAQERARHLFTAMQRRSLPGSGPEDRYAQVNNYTGAVYVAIQRRMKILGGATVTVKQRTNKQASKAKETDSEEWTPVPDNHPAAKLFRRPNAQQSIGQFLSEYEMILQTGGRCITYAVPGLRTGKPVELWALRNQYIAPSMQFGPEYPYGAWWVTIPSPMTYGFGSTGTVIIDARHTVKHLLPHPMYPYDGYSPLNAMGLGIDTLRKIGETRQVMMNKGGSVDTVVTIPGASQEELDRVKREHEEKYTGLHKGAKVLFTNGDGGLSIAALGSATPSEMAFESGYEQETKGVLAGFGVTGPVSGMTDATSFAQLYASIKQLNTLEMEPEAKEISDVFNMHLVEPNWPDCKVFIEVKTIDDPDREDKRYDADKNILTVNERRKMGDREPFGSEGDVPEQIYLAALQAGVQGNLSPQAPDAQMPAQRLRAGGKFAPRMTAQGNPPEPQAPVDQPTPGNLSKGSLPGFTKALPADVDFDVWKILDEVAPIPQGL